jgi:hypothetical protein
MKIDRTDGEFCLLQEGHSMLDRANGKRISLVPPLLSCAGPKIFR